MCCVLLVFFRLFYLLAKQWSFATSTLFRLSWSTAGWLSRLRRLQNKKLRSRYSLLLTQLSTLYGAVLLTHKFIVLLTNNIWSSNPITPAHSFHHHHKNPKKKINCLEKPHFDPVVDSPTCGFNCRPRISSISKLGLMQQYLYTP